MLCYKELPKSVITISIIFILLCTICGCSSSRDKEKNFYAMPKIITHDQNCCSIENNLINPNRLKLNPYARYSFYEVAYDIENDPEERRAARNALQTQIMDLSDEVIDEHLSEIFKTEDRSNIALGTAAFVLNAISASVTPSSTTTALTSASTAVSGTRLLINEELFSNEFAPTISKAIRSSRHKRRIDLEVKRQGDINKYGIGDAVSDAIDYHKLGSFYHGLELVQKKISRSIGEDDKKARIVEEDVLIPRVKMDYSSTENKDLRGYLSELLDKDLIAEKVKKDYLDFKETTTKAFADMLVMQKIDRGSTLAGVRIRGGARLKELTELLAPYVQ